MKKIWTTAIIIGMLAMILNTTVSAGEDSKNGLIYSDSEQIVENADDLDILFEEKSDYDSSTLDTEINEKELENERQIKLNQAYEQRKKFRGVWGYADGNETAGYIGGFIGRRGRFGYLKAIWNNSDDTKNGKVVGILKHGYFNGRVVTENGSCRITGFYKINKEKQTLNIRWMTKNNMGWAHLRVKLN